MRNPDRGSFLLPPRSLTAPSSLSSHISEFLQNAQGEDVVAGIRTPLPLSELQRIMPEVFKELVDVTLKLEADMKDMQV